MAKQDTRKPRSPVIGEADLSDLLEFVLAFDQAVVEFSMNLYNVHEPERVAIRAQNRRLHEALRERPYPFIPAALPLRRPKYRRLPA